MEDNHEDQDYANSTLSFPHKLFILLESGEHVDLIHWVEHGMCFRIEETDKFADVVIPKFFKQTKLTSFQRQLNLYGFRRLTKGDDQGCYFHPKFQRNRKDLLAEIKRLPVKGSLQTYDQVMAAMTNRPSERFGSSKRKLDSTAPSSSGEVSRKKIPISNSGHADENTTPIATQTTVGSGLIATSNPFFPRISKLTVNIGYPKFIESLQQSMNGRIAAPPREEHLLRNSVRQQQYSTKQEENNFILAETETISSWSPIPFSSNFAGESLPRCDSKLISDDIRSTFEDCNFLEFFDAPDLDISTQDLF